jgi:uncharacterized alpha/beta hydrolase family protein
MTATVYIINTKQRKMFCQPNKPVVIKAAYHSSKEVKMPEDLMKTALKATKNSECVLLGGR